LSNNAKTLHMMHF